MAKFSNLKKRDLKNAQHFAFIQAFITAVTAAGFTAQRIVSALAALVAAFQNEDHHYMQFRASEIVAQRTAADDKRDRYYTRLHRLVQAWAGSGMELLDAAATALLRIFNLYKVKVSAQIDEETGQMENLITDLSTTEMQAHIATINGTYLFQQMQEGHEAVKALRLEEGAEVSERVMGALASARQEDDRLYDELCAIIEGASLFADDPTAYEQFIKTWNGTLKIYQDMLDRKSGSSIGSGNTGENSDTNTDSNNGTNNVDNNGGSGDNNGGSNNGDNNGGSGDTGGGSGDNNGGSGDNNGGSGDNNGGSGDNNGGSGDNGDGLDMG